MHNARGWNNVFFIASSALLVLLGAVVVQGNEFAGLGPDLGPGDDDWNLLEK